ncbi:PREDICTED: uncharacterized protein LOC107102318 [Cyprinodon variegatus]|uniref:uncharacterized protein LOC107102318 n=1 Tax=Cyprinodon variegatus TaxID=28743 RepID=UPI000742AF66|nr:PREDICTED: uncharacterized protein LOC107102318 [Cyprinodon variegatus]
MSSRALKGSPSCSWLLSDRKMMKMLVVFGILLHAPALVSALQAKEGDPFVLLPCQFDTFEVTNPTVLWTFSSSTVHRRQQGEDQLQDQDPRYRGRTSMRTDALADKDLSLNLTKLVLSDSGNYSCIVRDHREEIHRESVTLQVEGGFPSWATALLVVLGILVFCISGGVLFCFRQHFMSEYRVPLGYNKKSVLLPCKTTACLSEDVRVEWTDEGGRKVHVYENGSDLPDEQDGLYKTRTAMEKKFKSGDVSLTLKHPSDEDKNIYTCKIYSQGKILTQKTVTLYIKGAKKGKSSIV